MSLTQAQKTPIKHAAEKLGLKTLDAYNGFHMAHIDSIAIGDIIYKDPIAFVFDPLTQEKTLEQRDGVIGIDFIRRMGEICIDARAKELIFPISNRPLKSCFLKSPFLRNVVIKPHSAAFFNKSPKNPHGSFEVICSRSQQYIDSISEDPFIKVAPKTTF